MSSPGVHSARKGKGSSILASDLDDELSRGFGGMSLTPSREPTVKDGSDSELLGALDSEPDGTSLTQSPSRSRASSIPPPQHLVDQAISKLDQMLHPKSRDRVEPLTPFLRTRLERMLIFLQTYKMRGYENWRDASLAAATLVGKSEYLAKCLRQWCHAFINDGSLPTHGRAEPRTQKPPNRYGLGPIPLSPTAQRGGPKGRRNSARESEAVEF